MEVLGLRNWLATVVGWSVFIRLLLIVVVVVPGGGCGENVGGAVTIIDVLQGGEGSGTMMNTTMMMMKLNYCNSHHHQSKRLVEREMRMFEVFEQKPSYVQVVVGFMYSFISLKNGRAPVLFYSFILTKK